jgi:hypothetical protein
LPQPENHIMPPQTTEMNGQVSPSDSVEETQTDAGVAQGAPPADTGNLAQASGDREQQMDLPIDDLREDIRKDDTSPMRHYAPQPEELVSSGQAVEKPVNVVFSGTAGVLFFELKLILF